MKIDSICVGFGDHDDEVTRAKEISRQYDCDFHEYTLTMFWKIFQS